MGWTTLLYWLLRRRIRSTWPLLVITSFGIISAVTLMAVGAGYSRVLAEGGLRHTLASTSPRVLNVHLITQNRPIGTADYTQLRSAVEGISESRLGFMIRSMGRYGIVPVAHRPVGRLSAFGCADRTSLLSHGVPRTLDPRGGPLAGGAPGDQRRRC